jgi:hypothetical protein
MVSVTLARMSTPEQKRSVISIKREALLMVCGGAVLLGGFSLFLDYTGTPFMKMCVLLSSVAAFIVVRFRPVYPFGIKKQSLFRPRGLDLGDPDIQAFTDLLEKQKTRWLPLVGFLWVLVTIGLSTIGFLQPPPLTEQLANSGHAFKQLAPWPSVQLATDYLFIGAVVCTFSVIGSAYVLSLFFYLMALRKDAGKYDSARPDGT